VRANDAPTGARQLPSIDRQCERSVEPLLDRAAAACPAEQLRDLHRQVVLGSAAATGRAGRSTERHRQLAERHVLRAAPGRFVLGRDPHRRQLGPRHAQRVGVPLHEPARQQLPHRLVERFLHAPTGTLETPGSSHAVEHEPIGDRPLHLDHLPYEPLQLRSRARLVQFDPRLGDLEFRYRVRHAPAARIDAGDRARSAVARTTRPAPATAAGFELRKPRLELRDARLELVDAVRVAHRSASATGGSSPDRRRRRASTTKKPSMNTTAPPTSRYSPYRPIHDWPPT
jgi:hypothetical protein